MPGEGALLHDGVALRWDSSGKDLCARSTCLCRVANLVKAAPPPLGINGLTLLLQVGMGLGALARRGAPSLRH